MRLWSDWNSRTLLAGMQNGTNCCKMWSFLEKLKIDLQYGPAIPLLDIYPKELESRFQGEMCTPCSRHGDKVAEVWTLGASAGVFTTPVAQDSPPSVAAVRVCAPFCCSV